MKVSDEMVELMCHAYNDAVSQHAFAPWDGMRAALEAALTGCHVVRGQPHQIRSPNGGVRKVARIGANLPSNLIGKRVALVPLDD